MRTDICNFEFLADAPLAPPPVPTKTEFSVLSVPFKP
jgi:hypothetical protein